MTIHIKNSNLNGSPIIKGNNNNVEVNIQSSIEKINWNSLQDELIEALNSAMNKDERGLVNIVKRNISSFTSDIFTGVASRMLVEFLMSLI